jgi:beta-glucosidase
MFSEGPHVLGVISASYINVKLINRPNDAEMLAATAKHFVANDIEKRRRFLTVEIDERTLREIYLYSFQLIRKFSDPWCFMTRYFSSSRGDFCS